MPIRSTLVRVTWVWQSNSPGSRWRPPTSTASSPSSPGPTSTIRPPSMSTSASAGGVPVPSKTTPPVSSVLVTGAARSARSSLRVPVLALTGPLGGEQIVGEADHVAPRVGDLDQPAGAQLARLAKQGHPGRGKGLAGGAGVRDLQPQPRRGPGRPRGHVPGPHDQAGLLVAEAEADHPGVGEVELDPEAEPAAVEALGDLQVADVQEDVVQAKHGDVAHSGHESRAGRGSSRRARVDNSHQEQASRTRAGGLAPAARGGRYRCH